MNIIARIRSAIKALIRSHDGSTPEHPRKDGTYGWPRKELLFVVNGRIESTTESMLTYEELVDLAGGQPGYTVSVHYRRGDDKRGRSPRAGESVAVSEGMVVNVADTSRA